MKLDALFRLIYQFMYFVYIAIYSFNPVYQILSNIHVNNVF